MAKKSLCLAVLITAVFVTTGTAIETREYQMREDFEMAPLSDCILQYYYYIPCPTYSWLWSYSGWLEDDIVGAWFQIGDLSTGGYAPCDPADCHAIETLRVLDFAGYCGYPRYPGLCWVDIDIYCADEYGCPIGPPIWHYPYWLTDFAWNYLDIDPPISICECAVNPGPPPSGPRILVTATHHGSLSQYPAWGFDNISTNVQQGCAMHDIGCLPVLYPRPYSSHYATVHSGFYGNASAMYCPPLWFMDGRDSTPDGSQYGFIELTWRLYVTCTGPSETQSTTWSSLKSLYR